MIKLRVSGDVFYYDEPRTALWFWEWHKPRSLADWRISIENVIRKLEVEHGLSR